MRIIYAILVLFCTYNAQAQQFSRLQAQKDAAALQRMVLKVHPSPDAYITKDSFRTIIKGLMDFEGDSIAAKDWEIRIRHALLPIGCGHTYMARVKSKTKQKSKYALPFQVFCQKDRIWAISGVDSVKTDIIPAGAEILSIGNYKSADLIATMRRHQPSDGYNTTFQGRVINRDLYFNYLFMKYFSTDSVQFIRWADRAGIEHYQKVKCLLEDELVGSETKSDTTIKVIHRSKKVPQFFFYHPEHDSIGVLKLNTFSGRAGTKLFQKAITDLNQKKTPYLVIDLRDNTGGNFSSSINLIRYISNQSFKIEFSRRLFRSWRHHLPKQYLGRVASFANLGLLRVFPPKIKHGKTYRTIKYKPSKKHHYNGQVFVLINGMSFSASSQTATFLKENSNAIIIGEETGGGSRAINGMQIPVLRLPESRLLIHIPQVHLKYQLGKDEGKGVMPDIPINYTLDDVLAHKKLEWEAVLNWITSQPSVKNN